MSAELPPVCDYEGSDYQERFWGGEARQYEDQVERIALRRLMPAKGNTLIEIGAGFGRLADEYHSYQKVILFDYSRSLLRQAQENLGDDPRFLYVAGNWYKMPFVANAFDTLVQIRTLHHAADVPTLLDQLSRIAQSNSTYILEFASKHNAKAMLRYWLGQQEWSPFAREPIEFVELNFNFHPQWIRQQLKTAAFQPKHTLTVSRYRFGPLKRFMPTGLLVYLDSLWQGTGKWWQLTPSVFIQSIHDIKAEAASEKGFFACPECLTPLGEIENGRLICHNPSCNLQWRVDNGLYDFKEPVY